MKSPSQAPSASGDGGRSGVGVLALGVRQMAPFSESEREIANRAFVSDHGCLRRRFAIRMVVHLRQSQGRGI